MSVSSNDNDKLDATLLVKSIQGDKNTDFYCIIDILG